MKIAIFVPDDVFRAAEDAARRLRMPRSRLYARAIESYLAQQGRPDVTERLNAVYGKKRSRPDRALLEQSVETLRRAEWKK